MRLRATAGVLVTAQLPANAATCGDCGGPTRVQKTWVRGGATIAHGSVRIGLKVRVCRAGCQADAARHSTDLSAVFPARATFGYDVIVRVGLDRFVHYRQRHEIRAALAAEGVEVSEAQISLLGRKFLSYLEALHRARAPALRAALAADGWPMHVDATGEDGRGTLLVVYAGWRRWGLGAWKVPTERADAILPRLRQTADRFGAPCAIMRDLGRAVIEAAATFAAEQTPDTLILACHMHFLRDVGKDLMRKAHDEMRGRVRHFKLFPKLRALARDLGRKLGTALPQARKAVEQWIDHRDQGHRLPAGNYGLAVVRALAQWVLDFRHDGLDQGFPFDVHMLDFYDRGIEVLDSLDAFLRIPPNDPKVRKAAERLHRILRPLDCEVPFERIAGELRERRALFLELRDALRLGTKPDHLKRPPAEENVDLELVRDAVGALTASLRTRRPARGPAKVTRRGIDIVLQHLDRHGYSLWGHAIRLPDGTIRFVDRTNNLLECFFHWLKHDERRRSGRRILTNDLENLPPAAALARNLTRADYVEILCGSLDNLPAAFAKLDADGIATFDDRMPDDEIVTRSLPIPDRDIVRKDEMSARIFAAASSRAPRR